MLRISFILACFFIYANLFAQSAVSGGEYPFVHYSPKDGLISNQVQNIYQDSQGRLYFSAKNGLSVYDGVRFTNYTTKNGLNYDIVNCVMEMGKDSVWVVTNSNAINCLVNDKMKTLKIKGLDFAINDLCRDEKGNLYAVSNKGLYIFTKDNFISLPLFNTKGEDVNAFTSLLIDDGNYLLIQRDPALSGEKEHFLYLYNKTSRKITAELSGIHSISKAPDGRIWASTEKNIMALDTDALLHDKLLLKPLPTPFNEVRDFGNFFIAFDSRNNCWAGDQTSILMKIKPDGSVTSFTSSSGLSMFFINYIFCDREGITWIATNDAGVDKLVNSNFSIISKPYNLPPPYNIAYNQNKNSLLIYSINKKEAAVIDNGKQTILKIENAAEVSQLVETPYGYYGIGENAIFKFRQQSNTLFAEPILKDSLKNVYSCCLVDANGNLIVCGTYNVSAVVNGNKIFTQKINYYADNPATDSKGNIWVVTRAGDLTMYHPAPGQPLNYLEQTAYFKKELSGFSPRSIAIDKNDNIWIGTRINGLQVFRFQNNQLKKIFALTNASGLSDNFISHLSCDADNTIWASTPLGLDKIAVKNNVPSVENITIQNNIYQTVFKTVFDKENTTWGILSNGILKITRQQEQSTSYKPSLLITMVKAGKDTLFEKNGADLNYKQNNLSFNFAATSYWGEKQTLYSFRLLGGSNNQWSEPSGNTAVSFIDLPPGKYNLEVKAIFPAGRYPEQTTSYQFFINPAWWQTVWFRGIAVLLIIGLLIVGFRFYFRRKLEKEKAVLEKQQAIEKERTRIATDMHDDLGAGLSRIKYLSQSLLNKQSEEVMKPELEKITAFSDEMSEKMGEIIWALNEKNDTLADLIAYTRSYAAEYLASHGIQCDADTPMNLPGTFIPGEMRRNIFLSVKECLHNIVKHAGATKVSLSINLNHNMQIVIHDNGKGIDLKTQRLFSNGIQNIENRMRKINGKVSFTNENGTKMYMTIPVIL